MVRDLKTILSDFKNAPTIWVDLFEGNFMLNDRIFKLYELSEEEIKYIKDSLY